MCGEWGWGGGWVLGGLAMFLFWGLIVLVIVLAVRAAARSSSNAEVRGGVGEKPLDILRRRYAAGEISREQFEQMRRDLE